MVNNADPRVILLDETDVDRLLRVLYNGTRPRNVHTLVCGCGATGDLRQSPRAWNGWQILPHAECPGCLARGQAIQSEDRHPEHARARFERALAQLGKGR
jgi:hypothetical protein